MAPEIETIGTVDLTPMFHYTRETEIVKRFIEKVLTLSGPDHIGSEVLELTRDQHVVNAVVRAMGDILTNDVERQIRITKTFPLQQQIWFHEFYAYDATEGGFGNQIPCRECDGMPDSLVHKLA